MKLQSKINNIVAFAGLSVVFLATAPAQAVTITAWTFDNLPAVINNSPTASTGSGTASSLGMTNSYTYSDGATGSTTTDDVTTSALGNTSSTGANNMWRVRGGGTAPANGNGWNLAAPQYTQGAQFTTSTVGYSNIVFSFDWGVTNQGVNKLQTQYTVNGTNWINVGSLLTATPNAFTNNLSVNFGTLGITTANNNANFGVRLVSAYDSTLGTYGSASGGIYNNNSGNWRFDNVVFSGTASATAVPEPFTIVGTVMGGAAALRMRKRLKVENKNLG
jgi:hypothetical protein